MTPTSNGGCVDARLWKFYKDYLPEEEFTDPATGKKYELLGWQSGSGGCPSIDPTCNINSDNTGYWSSPQVGQFNFNAGGSCNGDKLDDGPTASKANTFAIRAKLEGGGYVCISTESLH